MEVKTYKLINGLFQPRNPDDHARFSGEQRVVFASDYDTLAADKADDVRRMADDADKLHAAYTRIRALEAALTEALEYIGQDSELPPFFDRLCKIADGSPSEKKS